MTNPHENQPQADDSRDAQFRLEYFANATYATFLTVDEYIARRREDFAAVVEWPQ